MHVSVELEPETLNWILLLHIVLILHQIMCVILLTLWRPLLIYGYSYKVSCARPR